MIEFFLFLDLDLLYYFIHQKPRHTSKEKKDEDHDITLRLLSDYFTIFSNTLSNTAGNATAILDNTFLSRRMSLSPIWATKVLYFSPFSLMTADNLSIQSLLKSLFFSFLLIYACCPCLTNANLTCLYTLLLPSLNPLASLINFLCLLCLWSPFLTLTIF